jgi:7-cyano-7-deazaguanine synthase
MARPATLILTSGGLRSLVATATTLTGTPAPSVVLLHIQDGRAAAPRRLEHARRQALHFGASCLIELDASHVYDTPRPQPNRPAPPAVLVRPQLLLSAVAQALQLGMTSIVFPVQFDADFAAMSRATEELVLVHHLVQIEDAALPYPKVETPLLELTDQQVIELGAQLDVPWHLSWSCQKAGERPCRVCPACERRRGAFSAARMEDPLEHLAVAQG